MGSPILQRWVRGAWGSHMRPMFEGNARGYLIYSHHIRSLYERLISLCHSYSSSITHLRLNLVQLRNKIKKYTIRKNLGLHFSIIRLVSSSEKSISLRVLRRVTTNIFHLSTMWFMMLSLYFKEDEYK